MEAEDAMYYDEEEDLMTDADLERALDALHEEAPEEVTDLLSKWFSIELCSMFKVFKRWWMRIR